MPKPKKDYPPELVARVRSLAERCHLQREIAAEVGLSAGTVRKIMRRHGIRPNGQSIFLAPDVLAQMRKMYDAGQTLDAVAEYAGVSRPTAAKALRSYGTVLRPPVYERTGDQSPNWIGRDAGYQTLHTRVEAARGKPQRCGCCDSVEPGRRYDWANLSGRYELLSDYVRMCRSCHKRFDNTRRLAGKQTRLADHVRHVHRQPPLFKVRGDRPDATEDVS